MKTFRRGMVIFLAAIILFSQFVATERKVKAGNLDIIVNSYTANGGNAIYKGTAFNMTIEVTKGDIASLDSLYIEIDNSSAFYGEKTNILKVPSDILTKINSGDLTTISGLRLVYKGSGNELKLNFKYSVAGEELISSQTIFVKDAISKEDVIIPDIDPLKFPPSIGIVGGTTIPSIKAGTYQTINLPIKNTSQNAARNILMTLEMEDKTKAPMVLDVINLTQWLLYLNGNETKNIPFDLSVLNTAPDGVYTFKLSYQMENLFGATFTSSETIFIRVRNDSSAPNLTIESIQANPSTAVPGSKVNLKLVVRNTGSLDAKNIKISLNGLKSDAFTITEGSSNRYVNKLIGNDKYTAEFVLQASQLISSGSQPLDVKVEYKDTQNNPFSEESQIFIPVQGQSTSGKPQISIEKIMSPNTSIKSNADFSIGMNLVNLGTDVARNVKVTLSSDNMIVPKSLSTVIIDTLDVGKSIPVNFTLFATSDALNKNYPIAINVEYEKGEGDKAVKYSLSQYVGVLIDNPDGAGKDLGKSVPRIIVDKYSFEPTDVKAGVEFVLNLSFLNTSKLSKVSNIKVTVNSDDGAFVPVDSGNTFFIEEIGSKARVQKKITLRSKPDAEPKSYIIGVNFEYEDAKANPYSTRETVSVPVSQNARLVTGDLALPPETFTGQPLPIYLDFYNMGKSILYNLTIKTEGDFQAQNGNYFVGNFEPGRSDSFDAQITPNAAGQLKGNVIFAFEDAAGKKTEIKKEFNVNVSDMPPQPMPGEGKDPGMNPDGQPQVEKKFNILFAVIPASVLVIGVLTFIILRKRSIRRKEMTLDD